MAWGFQATLFGLNQLTVRSGKRGQRGGFFLKEAIEKSKHFPHCPLLSPPAANVAAPLASCKKPSQASSLLHTRTHIERGAHATGGFRFPKTVSPWFLSKQDLISFQEVLSKNWSNHNPWWEGPACLCVSLSWCWTSTSNPVQQGNKFNILEGSGSSLFPRDYSSLLFFFLSRPGFQFVLKGRKIWCGEGKGWRALHKDLARAIQRRKEASWSDLSLSLSLSLSRSLERAWEEVFHLMLILFKVCLLYTSPSPRD